MCSVRKYHGDEYEEKYLLEKEREKEREELKNKYKII
jgi:hypothetical protein